MKAEKPKLQLIEEPKKPKPGERCFSDLIEAYTNVTAKRDWTFESAFEGSPLIVLTAPEKSHKSWALIQMAIATVTGGPWLGRFKCLRPGPAVYLDGELGTHEFARRAAREIRGLGREPREVLPYIRHYYSADLRLDSDDEALQWLGLQLRAMAPRLVIIDPLRNHLAGEENSAPDMLAALNICITIRDKCDCPVVIAHHLNKAGTQSGSRALRTRCDISIEGSDEEDPVYRTIGRTLRMRDALSEAFTLSVEHQDDEDDTVAKTGVSLRFATEKQSSKTLSKVSLKVLELVKKSDVTKHAIRAQLKINNIVADRCLAELKHEGLIEWREGKVTLSTGEFFAELQGGQDA